MKENWQKENFEKSKEVLKEHFNRRKLEEMTKEMIRIRVKEPLQFNTIPAVEDLNIELTESKDFFEGLIWEKLGKDPIEGLKKIELKEVVMSWKEKSLKKKNIKLS